MADFQITLEPQGARRRAQLIQAAAHVIATEGLRACDHARVAALAGTTRGLIYKYFPKREDLLFAVLVAANDDQDRQVSPDIVARGLSGLTQGTGDAASADTKAWLDHYVGPPDAETGQRDLSVASITLTRAVTIDNPLGVHTAAFAERLEQRWLEPLRRSGLGEVESRVAAICVMALINHLQLRGIANEISPAEARRLFLKTATAIVQSLL
jgi:AcrR family transcriptional regulator